MPILKVDNVAVFDTVSEYKRFNSYCKDSKVKVKMKSMCSLPYFQ